MTLGLDGRSIQDLWTVVRKRYRRSRMVASILLDNGWIRDIAGPYTVLVLVQYVQLRERMMEVALDSASQDRFLWKWCPSGQYSSQTAYSALFLGQTMVHGARQI
jgi:hypothetical protein